MGNGLLHGVIAGAAGTTVLNAVTYADMAIRGRGTSDAPDQLISAAAEAADVKIPGDNETRENRIAGLGPLSGTGVGVLVGGVAGLIHAGLRSRGRRAPLLISALATGAAAMVLTDGPLAIFGVSDPRSWSGKDWLGDAVPHLAYGLSTQISLRVSDPR